MLYDGLGDAGVVAGVLCAAFVGLRCLLLDTLSSLLAGTGFRRGDGGGGTGRDVLRVSRCSVIVVMQR